jgi:hypothetical protein
MTTSIPTAEQLISDLKEQPGFKTLIEGVPDAEERKMLEDSVVALMHQYYLKVLKPLSEQ